MNWVSTWEQFSRMKHWYDWKDVASDADRWMNRELLYNVARFVSQIVHNFVFFVPVRALKRLPFRHANLSLSLTDGPVATWDDPTIYGGIQ